MPPKSILITGCSRGGIGAALALNLAKAGHHVFATARTPSKIPEELSVLSNVTVVPLDVTSASSIAQAVKAVAEDHHGPGRLDVLVNNSGVAYSMPILDMDVDKAQRLYDTNVWGPVRCVQAFSGLLIASRGRVVNVSTVGAVLHMPWICEFGDVVSLYRDASGTYL